MKLQFLEMRYLFMLYGNNSNGFSYSPDRSYDVDRFNPSTRANYPTSYNPNGYYSPDRSYDVDRFNPSTASNYKYFDPCKTYR
jgi:hypothetical protein